MKEVTGHHTAVDSQFHPPMRIAVLWPLPYRTDDYSFVISFQAETCASSSVGIFEIVLAILGSHNSDRVFNTCKDAGGILVGTTLNLYTSAEVTDLV